MFDLAGNASVDTDLSGYKKPACSLIEDSKNGEKEWLQMVAELEKIRFLHITEKVERRFL